MSLTAGPPAVTWRRVRRAAAGLSPEAIEQIAQRVVELLRGEGEQKAQQTPGPLLDAGELAQRLGVKREWVYEHARELGAVRLGDGPKARLRFDPEAAKRVLEKRRRPAGSPDPSNAAVEPRPARRRRRRPQGAVPLLPVYQPGKRRIRGLLARTRRGRR